MRKSDLAAKILTLAQVPRLLDTYWGANRLTVLAYHRITDSTAPSFDFYEPNVSATPQLFAAHMAYIEQHFNVISLAQLVGFISHQEPLPARPLLITFDDGYLDNYTHARPILMRHGFPAVIFLMTSGMEQPHTRPWWDFCAYCFYHTPQNSANLPGLGLAEWQTPAQKHQIRERVMAYLKTIPETEKKKHLAALPTELGVDAPPDEPIFVSWKQVGELVAAGIACQPHTVTHPILTRISDEQVFAELRDSRKVIATQTGQAVTAFAYPNGSRQDYSAVALRALATLGYQVAFTLLPGPMPFRKVRQTPLEISRVYLGRRDTFEMFTLKTMGLAALVSRKT